MLSSNLYSYACSIENCQRVQQYTHWIYFNHHILTFCMVHFFAILETLNSTNGKKILILRQRNVSKHCLLRFLRLNIGCSTECATKPSMTTKKRKKNTELLPLSIVIYDTYGLAFQNYASKIIDITKNGHEFIVWLDIWSGTVFSTAKMKSDRDLINHLKSKIHLKY